MPLARFSVSLPLPPAASVPGPEMVCDELLLSVSSPAPRSITGSAEVARTVPFTVTVSSPPRMSSTGWDEPPNTVPSTVTSVLVVPSSTMACAPTASMLPPRFTLTVAVVAPLPISTAWLSEDEVLITPLSVTVSSEPSPSTTPWLCDEEADTVPPTSTFALSPAMIAAELPDEMRTSPPRSTVMRAFEPWLSIALEPDDWAVTKPPSRTFTVSPSAVPRIAVALPDEDWTRPDTFTVESAPST